MNQFLYSGDHSLWNLNSSTKYITFPIFIAEVLADPIEVWHVKLGAIEAAVVPVFMGMSDESGADDSREASWWWKEPQRRTDTYLRWNLAQGVDSATGSEDWRALMFPINSMVAIYNIPTELLQEQVNTWKQRAYFANKQSCPLTLRSWGPQLGAHSNRTELKGWEVTLLLWSRSTAEQWLKLSLRCSTRRHLWSLNVGSQEPVIKAVQMMARVDGAGIGQSSTVRTLPRVPGRNTPSDSRKCERGENLKMARICERREGKGDSFTDKSYQANKDLGQLSSTLATHGLGWGRDRVGA